MRAPESERQSPPPGEVHVWWVDPEDVDAVWLTRRCREILTSAEWSRNDRFRFQRLKHDFLVRRWLVRNVLSRYAPVHPSAWVFHPNDYGRPYVEEPDPGLLFNISHTSGAITVGVRRGQELGIDVEDATRPGATIKIADRFFSVQEAAALHGLPQAEQRERFFTYWTLKEAYIKAKGMGLALPLGGFAFRVDQTPIGVTFSKELADDPDRWQFFFRRLTERHRLALALERSDGPPQIVVKRLFDKGNATVPGWDPG